MLRSLPSLLIPACSAALVMAATAAAQTPSPPALYGGGIVAERAPKPSAAAYTASTAIGIKRVAYGSRVSLRVSFGLGCGRYKGGGGRTTDVVTGAPLAADGSFHLKDKPVKTVEMGHVNLTIDGTLGPARADGTLQLRTHWPCGGELRSWTARPIDPLAPPPDADPAPVDGLLYGITDQDVRTSAPHGFVAKVEDGGTVAHAFTSYVSHCEGVDRKGGYTAQIGYQTVLRETPTTRPGGGGWLRNVQQTETAAQRRRHVDYDSQLRWQGAFSGAALKGEIFQLLRYREPGDRGRCSSGTHRFYADARKPILRHFQEVKCAPLRWRPVPS